MPIEPTSVSKPVIREVEKISSGQGLWTSMQGSSTGGKDRPLDSIWEKAISGAQKLFGLDASESAALEEKGESEEEALKKASEGSKETSARARDFSGRRFGFLASASPFGASAFASVSTDRPEYGGVVARFSAEPRGERESQETREAALPRREGPEQSKPATKEKIDPEGEDDEGKDKAEKVEPKPESRPAPLRPSPLSQSSVTAASPQAESLASAAAPARSETGPALNSPAASAAKSDSSRTGASVSGDRASAKGEALPNQRPPQLSPVSTSRQAAQGDPANAQARSRGIADGLAASATAKPIYGDASGPAKPLASGGAEPHPPASQKAFAKAGSAPEGATGAKPNEALPSRGEPLTLDPAKAREANSDALSRGPARSTPSTATPQASPAAPSGSAAASPASLAAEARDGLGRANAAESANSKGGDSTSDSAGSGGKELLKRDALSSNQARPGAARAPQADSVAANRAGASEGVEGGASANKSVGPPIAQAAATGLRAREASSAASRIQSPLAPNRNQGVQGVGANAVAGGGGLGVAQDGNAMNPAQASQQGGAQNQGSDGSAAQEFAASLSSAASSKGAEKPASDPSQSFEAKVEASSARRSLAASKTSQTSYVTKTTEEIKEVVATLTKSIDRLVTNRSGAMNFKISFEQGGSMTLRVSMEGGHVHTSMQTDVVGLETAVKAHWSELANDWGQKGVKLTAPQFQQSTEGEKAFENLNEFAQRQERQAASRNGDGRGRNGRSAPSQEPGAGGQPAAGDGDASRAGGSPGGSPNHIASDRELKAYA